MNQLSASVRHSISICICTFRRPHLLDELLTSLQRQDVDASSVEIVVTDNDPGGSAGQVLDHWMVSSKFQLIRLHEPTPNISLARNSCISASNGDLLAFIDDDEIPHQDWLAKLLAAQQEHDADIVLGPVLSALPPDTPGWILDGKFFDRPRHETGTPVSLHDARTGNALVRRQLLQDVPGPFDPDFGRTGGEDTLLFSKLLDAGARMTWCDEAIVTESVGPDRIRLTWLLRRSFRAGQSWLYSQARDNQSSRKATKWRLALRSLRSLGYSVPAFLVLAPFSRSRAARKLRSSAYDLGVLSATFGHRYFEYAS